MAILALFVSVRRNIIFIIDIIGYVLYITDIDECNEQTHTCDTENRYCNNTLGSYECLCNFGYSSNDTMNNTCGKFSFFYCSLQTQFCAECENGQVVLLTDGKPPEVNQTEGRVEVCINNIYTAVCNDHWDEHEALIVCRQLGFSVSIGVYCMYF